MSFRDGLLEGRAIAVGGGDGEAIVKHLMALGAQVDRVRDDAMEDEDGAAGWFAKRAPLDALVFCAGESFASGGPQRLQESIELGWRCARAAATGALIEAGRPARLLLVTPRPHAGPHAAAARAALENLARTLSVEWARFSITVVAIAPGQATTSVDVAELVCFLVSEAGAYFSGCRFDLGAVPALGRAGSQTS